MKTALKLFSGLVLGAFAFVLALAAPGTGSAEAYVSYDNTKSNYTNYSNKYYNLNSYKSTNTTYQKYNYGYNKTNTTNYRAYGYNHQKPSYSKPSQPAYNPGRTSQPSGGVSSADEQAMLNLINKERAAKGLKPLSMDSKLTQIARAKAKDMIDNNYFSHQSPTYGSPFDMMKNNGITYRYAGENLAGAPDVNTAHTNLMNSSGHRANILSDKYTKVGIGVVSGGPYGKMYVQEFNG
ncbi:serine protease [Desulforamulus profundi]|uniref:Serine protease n=1 Tax=Desulforamulus profundi TaxID=1383067 RepID=A0A2C6MHJ3_9FIRM|nr:CAP domain-containing protein [Desulforamulus profundi]PHJ38896.1 serine protease [Desulforamulus profundi]